MRHFAFYGRDRHNIKSSDVLPWSRSKIHQRWRFSQFSQWQQPQCQHPADHLLLFRGIKLKKAFEVTGKGNKSYIPLKNSIKVFEQVADWLLLSFIFYTSSFFLFRCILFSNYATFSHAQATNLAHVCLKFKACKHKNCTSLASAICLWRYR